MPLFVGGAYSKYTFETPELNETVANAKSQLTAMKEASGSAAQSLLKDNARIAASYRSLNSELASANPFASITAAAGALPQLVAGPIATMSRAVRTDIVGLRQSLEQVRAFAPLAAQASEASGQVKERAQAIEASIERLELTLQHVGIPRSALSAFFTDLGEMRAAVETLSGATATEIARANGSFGRTRSRNEVERRLENLQSQEGRPSNLLGQAGDVNAIEALVSAAKRGHDELSQLKQELRDLSAASGSTGLDHVAATILEASQAEAQFVATSAEATTAINKLAAAAGELQRLNAALEADIAITTDATATDQARTAAQAQAESMILSLTEAEARHAQATLAAADAESIHADSLARVADAQRALNALLAAAPVANQAGAQGIAGATPGLLAKLEADAAKQQQKIAADATARDADALARRLDNQNRIAVATTQSNAQIQAAQTAAAAQVTAKRLEGEQAILAKTTQDATIVAKAQIEAAAQVTAAQLKGAATVEAAQLASATKLSIQSARAAAGGLRAAGAPAQNPEIARLRSFAQAEVAARRYSSALEALDKALKLVVNDEVTLNRVQSTINRVQLLQAGPISGGLGNFGRELLAVTGYGSAAIIVFQGITKGIQAVTDSFNLVAELDLNRRSVDALVGSVGLGNRVFEQAIAFGQKYGFTQKDMGDAAQEAAVVLRTSNTEASKAFEVMARLQTRAPNKTFSDAVRAIAELQAGQLISIEKIFNFPSQLAQRMKAQIEAGMDPIAAVDAALTELGQTADVLTERTKGSSGAILALGLATEGFKKELGELLAPTGNAFLEFLRESALLATAATKQVVAFNEAQHGTAQGTTQGGVNDEKAVKAFQDQNWFTHFLALATMTMVSQDQIIKHQGEVRAALSQALPANEVLNNLIKLNNQLDVGIIGTANYAAGLDKIAAAGGIQPLDSEGIVKTASAISDLDTRAEALRTRFNALRKEADADPALAAKYLPQLLAIDHELVNIERHSPIVITMEMNLSTAGELTSALEAAGQKVTAAREKIDKIDEDARTKSNARAKKAMDSQIKYEAGLEAARMAHDRDVSRTNEDRAIADANRDQDRAIARSRQRRDERQEDAASAIDHADKLADIQSKLGDDLARIARETREKLAQAKGDFDVDQRRAQEDFDEERRKLLAEGKIKEAQELARKFEKDTRRKREDLSRGQSKTIDAGDEQVRDTTAGAAAATSAEEKQFAQQQARLKAQRKQAEEDAAQDQQRADEREQAARRLADQRRNTDYQTQRNALKTQHDQEVADINAQRLIDKSETEIAHKAANDELDKYLKEGTAKLEQAKRDQITIARLVREGMSAEAAAATVALQNAQNEFNKILGENANLFITAGQKDVFGYLNAFATNMIKIIHDAELGPTPIPNPRPGERAPLTPPPPHTPSKGEADSRAGLHSLTDRELDTLRAQSLAPGRYAPPTAGPVRQINVTVPVSATLDGQVVGAIASQHVTQKLGEDLEIVLSVTDASAHPGLRQAFVQDIS